MNDKTCQEDSQMPKNFKFMANFFSEKVHK